MKAIIIFAALIVVCSCAENKKEATDTEATSTEMAPATITVPDAVTNAFSAAYPGASLAEWENEAGRYEASFKNGEQEMSAIYNADGTLYATETEIPADQLPEPVRNAATTVGAAKEASKMTMADGTVHYEVEIGDKELIYDEQGKLVKGEAGDDEKEGDDD